jgi:putative transposase
VDILAGHGILTLEVAFAQRGGCLAFNWAAVVGKITGTVDQHLLHQNAYLLTENRVLHSRIDEKLRFTDTEQIALANAAKPIGRCLLADIATLVTPDTLLRWHRRLVEKTQPAKADAPGPGRPPTEEAVVELVLRLARENPSWGYDRLAGGLKELGHAISDTTAGNILKEHAQPPAPERKKGTTWAQFVATHKDVLCACDFFTKEVWTTRGLVTYYVLFFMHVASRKVHVAGMTANPNESWMKQIARNLTMAGEGFLDGMKYLVLDRDSKFAESFRAILKSAGTEPLRLPPRSPNLNAFAERFVRSIKEECLDHLILFGEASLHRAVDQFVEHYHHERPHQGKDNVILFPTTPIDSDSNPSRAGPILCNRRLGGLLKFYYRKAG